jgi:plasmid stabilization system protein ParE
MKYDVNVDDGVWQQLREAAHWYLQQSQSSEVAERWHRGFVETLQSLRENPLRFSLARENEIFDYELREVLYGSGRRKTHRALFRIVDDRVEVMLIRHVAQRDITPDDV